MLKSERKRLEAKKREWDKSLRAFERWWDKLKEDVKKAFEEVKKDFKDMINWLLFYRPKDKFDKGLHIFEVFVAWLIITTLYIRW